MLELEFTAEDLAYTRFALSPIWEMIASVQVLKYPDERSLHRPWVEATAPRLAASGLDWRPLADLVAPTMTAAFICPPPVTPAPDLEFELAMMRAQPASRVFADLDALGLPHYPDLAARLDRLAEIVKAYWDLAIAPFWPRIRSLLEGDILYRARLLTVGGTRRLFADLDPGISWEGDTLRVRQRLAARTVALEGRGLLLVPSVFSWPRIASLTSPGWQPLLRYPPRGVATLWQRDKRDVPAALAKVIGRSRATLLTLLDAPATTSDLAVRTGLTPGAISQHLTALRDARLVTPHRIGRHVLYARTSIAESLLAP